MSDREEKSKSFKNRVGKRLQNESAEDEADADTAEAEDTSATQTTSDTTNGSASAYDALMGNVRNTRVQKQYFLEGGQSSEIEQELKRLSYEYELEFDQDIERNAHFYPVLIQYGLEAVKEMDASDFHDALEEYNEYYSSD